MRGASIYFVNVYESLSVGNKNKRPLSIYGLLFNNPFLMVILYQALVFTDMCTILYQDLSNKRRIFSLSVALNFEVFIYLIQAF